MADAGLFQVVAHDAVVATLARVELLLQDAPVAGRRADQSARAHPSVRTFGQSGAQAAARQERDCYEESHWNIPNAASAAVPLLKNRRGHEGAVRIRATRRKILIEPPEVVLAEARHDRDHHVQAVVLAA